MCIEEQPAGELRIYNRVGKCVKEIEEGGEDDYRRYVVKGRDQDGTINIVFTDNDTVYLQRPVSESYYEGWVVGVIGPDKHTITVANGQYTAYTKSFDMAVQVWMMDYDAEGDTYVPDKDLESYTFTIGDDGSITLNGTNENRILGCVNRCFGTTWSYLDFEWHGIGDYESVYTPSEEVPLVPPTGLQTQQLIATTGYHDGIGWNPYNSTVQIGFDGDDVWLQGLTDLLPQAWLKGTREGNRLSFPSGQLLGSYYNTPVYMIGAEPDENGNPVVAEGITFEYDGEGTYTSYNDIMVSSSRININYVAYYLGMTLSTEPDGVVTPSGKLRTVEYTMNYQEPDENGRLISKFYMVNGGAADGLFYVQGISPYVPEAYIAGTIGDDNRLTFPSPQYLGDFFDEESGYTYPMYFQAFDGESGELKPQVTFDYDADTHAFLNPSTAISIGITKTGLLTQQFLYNVKLTPTKILEEQTIGWCSDELASNAWSVGIGEGELRISAAIRLPHSKMMRYEGHTITKIRFAVKPGLENVSVWIRTSLANSSEVVQSVAEVHNGWNEVELNTPFDIDGGEIFIGYTGTQPEGVKAILSYGEGDENTSWLAVDNQWDDYHADGVGILYIQAVAQGEVRDRGAVVISLQPDKAFYSAEESMVLDGELENLSSTEIDGCVLGFFIDDQLQARQTISQMMQPDEVLAFTQTLPLDAFVEGEHQLSVKVAYTGEQMQTPFYVYESAFPRTLLLEHFTSLNCVNCPPVDRLIEEVVKERNDVAWVTHRVGYKDDEFTLEQSRPLTRFGVGGNPYIMIDRTSPSPDDAPAFTVGSYSAEQLETIFDYYASMPAMIELQATATVEAGLLNISIAGEGKTFFNTLFPRAALHIFIVEDDVTAVGAQAGDAGKKQHDNILRAFVTPSRGVIPTWTADGNACMMSYDTQTDISDTWNTANLRVVAFLTAQAPSGTNYPTGEVLNSVQTKVAGSSAIQSVDAPSQLSVQWYSLDGRRLPSAPLSKGIYLHQGKKYIINQ